MSPGQPLKTRAPHFAPSVLDALSRVRRAGQADGCQHRTGTEHGSGFPLARRRTQGRLDGHVQLLFKHSPALYTEGKGTAAPCWRSYWSVTGGGRLLTSVSYSHPSLSLAVPVASNTGAKKKILSVN